MALGIFLLFIGDGPVSDTVLLVREAHEDKISLVELRRRERELFDGDDSHSS